MPGRRAQVQPAGGFASIVLSLTVQDARPSPVMSSNQPVPQALPPLDALAPGTELFGHRIGRILGKGGMGVVYLAEQLSLGRMVGLKILHPRMLKVPQAIEDFLREARAAGKLSHPHLVTVHDVFSDLDRGIFAYAMEYVSGVSATGLVAERFKTGATGLTKQEALHIIYQTAKALGHAHRAGMVHRDVKPDNILVTLDLTAKLLDLGLVRDRLEGRSGTGVGNRRLRIVGTPDFAAPEQSRNPDEASPASDVYALGATFYFLLTGRTPFDGETMIDLIVSSALDPLEYPDDFPADCRTLCELLMAKNAEQRPESGDAVVTMLEAFARGERLRAPSAAATSRPARKRRVRYRR